MSANGTRRKKTETTIAQRLRVYLEDAELTQRDLADLLGVTDQAVSKWLDPGQNLASWQRLADVCRAINVSADQILGLDEVARTSPPLSQRQLERLTDYLLAAQSLIQSATENSPNSADSRRLAIAAKSAARLERAGRGRRRQKAG